MPRLSFYVLKQLIGPVALFAFLMTCVVWLTQALRLLDLVINRGQSAPTFVYLTILVLPSLLVIILPIAFFAGTLYALSKLNTDSELVVMASAGFSRGQLAVPVFIAAAIVMSLTYLSGLYLMPAGQRAMKDKVVDIRADIGAALLNEGTFNPLSKGVTVFIREIDQDGRIRGVLVHDSRNPKHPITYLAESGEMVQTPAGARLIMLDGTVEVSADGGARLSVLKFQRDVFDLDQFAGPAPVINRAASELYLNELFSPPPTATPRMRNAYFAEANNRIAQPLYCIVFALIALAAVTRGRRARGANALRMTLACFAAAAVRIAGYGVQGLAENNQTFCLLFYIIPLLGALLALVALVADFSARPPVQTAEAVS
ncbi:MAG: LPS export ABC transporter permease LptF [Alphaproteobacteria bacterium]|nr:LPS export ABC transporter permease LptF [Alphaproteobacteria bacterium]MDE1987591.1 LPS export ABC transporter permease LptF [Alphaproteobacteria bacterium]MDE2162837.1 LPS export ABC transporter permease LptF [Alphaproteobacteria bacterium]MDE2265211.1 LPS export ABC transporter permease LptF [Alphaproteobacteria bacterium]MDE2499234.1 LPS export ABC transporter permease LptF [Alphaproteobacteria bacterium]